MRAAIWGEAVKLTGSLVGRIASIALVLGITLLASSMLLAAGTGNAQLLAKLGPAATADWNGFLLAAAQITAAGGLLGFGVVLAWMFGREFGDGTITGLFALPIGRVSIAVAKLAVFLGWAALVSIALGVSLLAAGAIAGLGVPSGDALAMLGRQVVLGAMTSALALPVAWIASLGRSVLAGVSTAIGLLVVAQVSVLAGAGGWMPLAAPALWARSEGAEVLPVQLLLLVPFSALAVGAIALTWQRLQLDR